MRSFTRSDAKVLGRLLSEVSQTELLPRFHGTVANSSREKTSSFDIVTDADEAAESLLTERLLDLYPDAEVIGEEAAARSPELLSRIQAADLAFIVDPVDGTKNFASGVPLFGIILAAVSGGEVVFGAIHDPICGDTSFALRGQGAWREGDRGPCAVLEVAPPVPVGRMQGVAGTNFLPEPLRTTVAQNLSRVSMNFWMRCAAHEYRMAAAGHCHFLVYNKLMPWDHAAGWLIHQEAGGFSAHFNGTPYKPWHTTGGLICAPDEQSFHELRAALLGPGST